MPTQRPICPYLPPPQKAMTHQCLTNLKGGPSGDYYLAALTYGHYLWLHGHSGRAILALTRALYANTLPNDPNLKRWPLPYAAIAWIVSKHPDDHFPGNPLISFQHQAARIRGPRQALQRARARAVWALIKMRRPDLPGDPAEQIPKLCGQTIASALEQFGHAGEAALWQGVYAPTVHLVCK